MKVLLLSLFILFQFLHTFTISSICVDSSLGIAITTDCSNLQIYKLQPGVCQSDFQTLVLDPSKIQTLHYLDQNLSGIPLFLLTQQDIQDIPKLYNFVSPPILIKRLGS